MIKRLSQKRPRVGIIIIAIVIMAILLIHFWPISPPAPRNNNEWVQVSPKPLEKTLGLTGTMQAARKQVVTAAFDATIERVPAKEGQVVTAGQELLSLVSPQLDIQLRDAQSEQIKARMDADALSHWGQSPDVARARRALRNAAEAARATGARLRDTQTLYRQGIVARSEVEDLENQLNQQKADLLAAQDELNTEKQKGEGENTRLADLSLKNAQEKYRVLQEMSSQKIVTAPFSGVLVHPVNPDTGKVITLQPGMHVSQGAPLFLLIDPARFEVVTRVEETDLQLIRPGQTVEVTGDGFSGQKLEGKIETIGIQSSVSVTTGAGVYYDLLISLATSLPPGENRIRPGMSARLSVITWRSPAGLVVPVSALHQDSNGQTWVHFRPDLKSTPVRVNVATGISLPEGIQVTGISAGYVESGSAGTVNDVQK